MSKPSISLVMHFCFVLLFVLSAENAMGESFSIHLVHPDNDAIVSSLNPNVDLQDYRKVVFPKKDKNEVLWINKHIDIDISALEKATLKWQKPFGTESVQKPLPFISISFTQRGRKKWADFTTRNVKRRAAILLDGIPLMAPVIVAPITEGVAQIMGDISTEEAQRIVKRLNELIARNRSM